MAIALLFCLGASVPSVQAASSSATASVLIIVPERRDEPSDPQWETGGSSGSESDPFLEPPADPSLERTITLLHDGNSTIVILTDSPRL